VLGLLSATIQVFFPDGIAFEPACEADGFSCTIDELSFKAYLIRWMAAATKLAPFIYDNVKAVLETSAKAAALQCSGSPVDHPNGRMCGSSWSKGSWDTSSGVGQEMAALQVIQGNLIQQAKAPLTGSTGGTSPDNPAAGTSNPSTPTPSPTAIKPPTTGATSSSGLPGGAKTGIPIGIVVFSIIIILFGFYWFRRRVKITGGQLGEKLLRPNTHELITTANTHELSTKHNMPEMDGRNSGRLKPAVVAVERRRQLSSNELDPTSHITSLSSNEIPLSPQELENSAGMSMSARQPASVVSKPRSITTVPVAETELSRLEEAAIDEKEEQKLQILRDRMERIRGEKERLKKIQELEVLEEQTKKEILNMQKRAGGGSGS
jgi:hypothetical protein